MSEQTDREEFDGIIRVSVEEEARAILEEQVLRTVRWRLHQREHGQPETQDMLTRQMMAEPSPKIHVVAPYAAALWMMSEGRMNGGC